MLYVKSYPTSDSSSLLQIGIIGLNSHQYQTYSIPGIVKYVGGKTFKIIDGYCCEDCDGPESTWRSWSIDNAITSIAIELDRIKILP